MADFINRQTPPFANHVSLLQPVFISSKGTPSSLHLHRLPPALHIHKTKCLCHLPPEVTPALPHNVARNEGGTAITANFLFAAFQVYYQIIARQMQIALNRFGFTTSHPNKMSA